MPPHSRTLAEEGAAIMSCKLVDGGVFQEEAITTILSTANPGLSLLGHTTMCSSLVAMCACACVCVRACACACERACVYERACACVNVRTCVRLSVYSQLSSWMA
jgi:hypothetical protein